MTDLIKIRCVEANDNCEFISGGITINDKDVT